MSELDSFDEIEEEGFKKSGINISNVYSVRIGGFGSNSLIKTYLSTLNVSELQSDVSLYDTLSQDKEWPVSQIIQREVDKNRINEISKKYLLAQGRDVKYFPPIIVALLPREENGSFSKNFSYSADQSDITKDLIVDKSQYRSNKKFKEILLSKSNISNVEGIYFFNTSQVFEHNIFCWDKAKIYAVVIDGQHRLDALIKAKEEDQAFYAALQDVIFLDVSGLVFKKSALTPVEVLRTIFIDINTNAKSVGLVRRILMDDKDLASLCVQSLVESVNSDGTSKSTDNYIPSPLIDWYGDSLKHELPHITGLLTMYQIISDELIDKRLVTIDDHRNKNKINSFINILNNYFFVDYTIKNDSEFNGITTLTTSFAKYLDEKEITREIFAQELIEDELDSILFTYDYRVLNVAQKNFEKYYLRSIVQIFEKITPYSGAIEILIELRAFDVNSNLYKALLSSTRKILTSPNLKNAYLESRRKLNEVLNLKYYLFYTVVGQKGIFNIFFEFLGKVFRLGSTEETVLKIQKKLTEDVNKVITILEFSECKLFGREEVFVDSGIELEEFGNLASSFWEGILFEDKRIIYNSQGVRTFADVLRFTLDIVNKIESGESVQHMHNYAIRFSTQRTKRLLSKRFDISSETELDRISNLILINKKIFLIKQIQSAYQAFESTLQ